MKILIVEDEKKVRDFIRQAIEEAGMVADTIATFSDLLAILQTASYDVIILDRLLFGHDALNAIPEIRQQQPQTKILVLSALSEVPEKVKGLTEGADDYLSKPFHVSELIARLRSLGRRETQSTKGLKDTELVFKDLKIDLEKQKVYRSSKPISLTRKELQLLTLFARSPGMVFSKTQILDQVWDFNHNPESNIIEVTIANLRAKLDKGFKPLIQNQRGVGYWLGES